MKASKQCPKCGSRKVGYLETVPDRDDQYHLASATAGLTKPHGWLNSQEGVGELEAYVCAACGFYETYVKDPGSVPFDTLDGFHWLNETLSTESPYR